MKRSSLLLPTILCLVAATDAQTPWNPSTAPAGPSARERPGGASDGSVFYLSGGKSGTSAAQINGDLWSYDGSSWTQITTSGAGFAPNRSGHAMVWDDARAKLVVFGGVTAPWPTRLNDTWEWDATNGWVDVTPASGSPSPRSFMASAYVPGLGMVIHGGQQASLPHASDTWAWDGFGWTLLATNGPERNVSAMAHRPPANDLILFGGSTSSATKLDETWRFDVSTFSWSQLPVATTPPGAVGMGMYFDPTTSLVVMHGGNAATNPSSATWVFGSDWVDDTPTPTGPTRRNMAIGWVASLGKGIAACGHNGAGVQNDLWERGASTPGSFSNLGTGCASSAGLTASVSAPGPMIGQVWTLTQNNTTQGAVPLSVVGYSDSDWLGVPLPIDFSLFYPLSPAGCQLQVRPNIIDPMVPGATSASFSTLIPNVPSIVGVVFYAQGIQVEFAGGLSLVGSDYGVAVIGG